MERLCVLFSLLLALPLTARAAEGGCVPIEQPVPAGASESASYVRMQLVEPANAGAVKAQRMSAASESCVSFFMKGPPQTEAKYRG